MSQSSAVEISAASDEIRRLSRAMREWFVRYEVLVACEIRVGPSECAEVHSRRSILPMCSNIPLFTFVSSATASAFQRDNFIFVVSRA